MHLFALVLLVALSRLIPHPPNFACMGALALFAGYNVRSVGGIALPLLALLLSDVIGHVLRAPGMGFYEPLTMAFVYGGFAAVTLLGRFIASNTPRSTRSGRLFATLFAASLVGSALFFLLSNFGVYLRGDYGYSFAGLSRCYVAAIPFFGNTVLGDLFFGVLLFGSAAAVGKLYGTGTMQPDLSGRNGISG